MNRATTSIGSVWCMHVRRIGRRNVRRTVRRMFGRMFGRMLRMGWMRCLKILEGVKYLRGKRQQSGASLPNCIVETPSIRVVCLYHVLLVPRSLCDILDPNFFFDESKIRRQKIKVERPTFKTMRLLDYAQAKQKKAHHYYIIPPLTPNTCVNSVCNAVTAGIVGKTAGRPADVQSAGSLPLLGSEEISCSFVTPERTQERDSQGRDFSSKILHAGVLLAGVRLARPCARLQAVRMHDMRVRCLAGAHTLRCRKCCLRYVSFIKLSEGLHILIFSATLRTAYTAYIAYEKKTRTNERDSSRKEEEEERKKKAIR